MAYTSSTSGVVSPFALIGSVFAALGNALVSIGEANSKMRQVEALQALSDAELAERGIKRSDIARVVFADTYWV
jgi:uncharacterized protein YjiS (DUF1127 family)